MGVDIGAALMIGEMFSHDEDDFDELDFDELDSLDFDVEGNHFSGSYICVGTTLARTDLYDTYTRISEVENYDFMEEKITERLQRLLPNRKLNVGMYLVTTIN